MDAVFLNNTEQGKIVTPPSAPRRGQPPQKYQGLDGSFTPVRRGGPREEDDNSWDDEKKEDPTVRRVLNFSDC